MTLYDRELIFLGYWALNSRETSHLGTTNFRGKGTVRTCLQIFISFPLFVDALSPKYGEFPSHLVAGVVPSATRSPQCLHCGAFFVFYLLHNFLVHVLFLFVGPFHRDD